MTATTPPTGAAVAAPRRFDAVTIGLHWATVALVLAQFASAWSLGLAPNRADADLVLTLHRSLGAITWVVAAGRLAWRLTCAYLPPFPPAMPRPHRWTATISEYGLYGLLLVQPITGLAQTLTRGRPFRLLAWTAPKLMERDKELTHVFGRIHQLTALALLTLIALHVAAALFHRLILRDEVLGSMLPWRPGPRGRE